MNLSNAFLARCLALKHAGYDGEFDLGAIVARGFADLGYEAFCLLTENKLLSLFTGKITSWSADERGHLFLVPDADDLIRFIQDKCGYSVNCDTIDGRTWKIISGQNKVIGEHPSPSLLEALIEVSINILLGVPNA